MTQKELVGMIVFTVTVAVVGSALMGAAITLAVTSEIGDILFKKKTK